MRPVQDEQSVSAVRQALYRGDREEARALVTEGADVNVFDAAALGDEAGVRSLLDADPGASRAWSADGFTALHLAAFLGGPDVVSVLVDAGADVSAVAQNGMRVQPLHSAAAAGDRESCRLLLDAGADPNAEQQGGFRPLDAALANDDGALSALLQGRGATPSERPDPATPG